MVSFTSNKIFLDSETVAEQLRSARQVRELKLSEVAKRLKISLKYLEALEKGQLEKLPQGVYGKNFLREYAIFLDLDEKELMKVFERENFTPAASGEELFCQHASKSHYFLTLPRIIKNSLIAGLIVLCFLYLGRRLEMIVAAPSLVVTSPQENLITTDKTIKLSGTAEAETEVDINGESILSDSNGNFSKQIDLKDGVNLITVTAKKKYGRESTIQRQILVKGDNNSNIN